MLFVQNGEGVQIDSAPTIERERDDLILSLKARGFGLRKIAEVINRSHMYVKRRLAELKSSAEYEVAASQADDERLGPPGSVPWFGANPAWSPKVEQSKGTNGTNGTNGSKVKVCRKCGKDLGPIQYNSVFVCLACTRTCRDQAIENELRRERIVKEEAEQREAERRAAELEERRAARRERKKASKASKAKRDK